MSLSSLKKNKDVTQLRFFESILSQMNEACIIIDLSFEIKLFNPSARKIFLEHSPQLGQTITNWSDGAFVNDILNQINDTSNKSSTVQLASGIYLTISIKRIESSKSIVGYILIVSDVTDQMMLRRELETNKRLKYLGTLAATVAHEIKNPLAVIKGYLSMLETEPKMFETYSNKIMRSVNTIDRTIQTILDYSRPVSIRKVIISTDILLNDIMSYVDTAHASRGEVSFEIESNNLLEQFTQDEYHLKSCVMHLINNAYESITGHGRVVLTVDLTKKQIAFSINDTGKGISEMDHENIFQPMYSTKIKGTGLGLPTVKKTIDALGGELKITSVVGEGTQIQAIIPLN
ncbi:ATP-binding protein [Chlamydiia bacterium]|nr:ATP-binding protein [Chlamydiia bacterium]